MDYQGGQGNGSAWYCNNFDAPLLKFSQYTKYSNMAIGAIDANDVKADLGAAKASAEAAPLVNYLNWLLDIIVKVA